MILPIISQKLGVAGVFREKFRLANIANLKVKTRANDAGFWVVPLWRFELQS